MSQQRRLEILRRQVEPPVVVLRVLSEPGTKISSKFRTLSVDDRPAEVEKRSNELPEEVLAARVAPAELVLGLALVGPARSEDCGR